MTTEPPSSEGLAGSADALGSAAAARWEEIFDQLVELPAPERQRRLDELRATNRALADQLERLLLADAAGTGFLDRTTLDLLGENPDGNADAEPQLPAGTILGNWRVVSLLGRGGMGEVYLAERTDPAFEQRVAIKVVKRGMDSQAILQRFVRERQILARLDHPNLARLLDGGTAPDGRPYFAMEWVEGKPITTYCQRRGLDLVARLRLLQTVSQAVDCAHRHLVVHRDLKPANILVTADGTAKLLDFGIAKLLADDEAERLTITHDGGRVLTPAYAAPEQILGEPVSTATDVYALGVLLYELITGGLPHRRDSRSLGALAGTLGTETVERPSAALRRLGSGARLARQVGGDLDLIVLTALHRDPARRYPSAQALADDLGHFLAGRPIRARPDDLGYRVRKFTGRHRLAVAAVGIGVAAIVLGLGLSLWQARAARLSARRAERVKSFLISVFRQSDPDSGDGARLTARELLERGAASIEQGLAKEPEVQADLLDALARIENNLGLLEPAFAHARRALALRQANLAPSDGRIGMSLQALGEVQDQRGTDREARQYFEAALAVLVPAFGADSIEVATARRGLAGTMQQPRDRGRAVELLRQALASFVRHFGENHVESAETLHLLGFALEVDQRYVEAEAAYRRSAALIERTCGPRSMMTARVQLDLAGLLDRLGNRAQARPLFERAIASQRAAVGPRHIKLAQSLVSYAILLIHEQEHAAADRALLEALAIYGPGRQASGHCLRYLGLSAMGQERYAAAAGLFTRAVETYSQVGDDDDGQRWRALANLGWAHSRSGRVSEGRAEITTAVAALERLGGPEAYELRLPLEQLGEVLIAAGEANMAVTTLRRVRGLDAKLFGGIDHREVAGTDLLLARALRARGTGADDREARRWLDEGLGIFARAEPRDVLRGESLLESGRLALTEDNRVRARGDLAAAASLLTVRKGAAHAQTAEARRLLAAAGGDS